MKKLIFSLITVIITSSVFSQKVFDKYIDSDNVGTVVINKSMLGLIAQFSDNQESKETQDFIDLAKNIEEIKIYISENEVASIDMNKTVKNHLKKSSMEELIKVREGDTHIDFYVKNTKNDNIVSQLFMFVNGIDNKKSETIIVTINGEIELDKLGALVSKMQLPKELERAARK